MLPERLALFETLAVVALDSLMLEEADLLFVLERLREVEGVSEELPVFDGVREALRVMLLVLEALAESEEETEGDAGRQGKARETSGAGAMVLLPLCETATLHVPTRAHVAFAPAIVQLPEAAKARGRSDEAEHVRRADWPTRRLAGGAEHDMSCGCSTVTVKVTGKAAANRKLPGCFAVKVQTPLAAPVVTMNWSVTQSGELEVYTIGRELFAAQVRICDAFSAMRMAWHVMV